jgi:hypothetical protein
VAEASANGKPAFFGYRSKSTAFGSMAVVTELNDSTTFTGEINTCTEDDAQKVPADELLEVADQIAGGLSQR